MRGILGLLVAVVMLVACGSEEERPATATSRVQASGKPVVYVTNYPLKYFAQQIGGDAVDVRFPAPEDEDPAFWTPDRETLAGFQKADVILFNGAGYEGWAQTVSLPSEKIVDTSAGFKDQYIPVEDAVAHSHGPGGEHAHKGSNFNTWLDPKLAAQQAEAVAEALRRELPTDKPADVAANLAALKEKLSGVDAKFAAVSVSHKGAPIFGSHPVYDYFARAYGYRILSHHWEPGDMPPPAEWEKLAAELKEHPGKVMLWEDEPLPEVRKKLEEMGIGVVVFYTAGNTPPESEGDYVATMEKNAERLAAGLK